MTANSNAMAAPRRGEIWFAHTGGKRHAMIIVSLDERNLSDRAGSVLAVPFGSQGMPGPTVIPMSPGETGLPEASYLKAHFVGVVQKKDLIRSLPRKLSSSQMRRIVAAVNRAIDPDAPFQEN